MELFTLTNFAREILQYITKRDKPQATKTYVVTVEVCKFTQNQIKAHYFPNYIAAIRILVYVVAVYHCCFYHFIISECVVRSVS